MTFRSLGNIWESGSLKQKMQMLEALFQYKSVTFGALCDKTFSNADYYNWQHFIIMNRLAMRPDPEMMETKRKNDSPGTVRLSF